MKEYIVESGDALYNENTGKAVFNLIVNGELIRCKDCKHRPSVVDDEDEEDMEIEFPDCICPCQCEDYYYSWMPKDDWFCANGERRES